MAQQQIQQLIEAKDTNIVFQDDFIVVFANLSPITFGHIRIFPKEQYQNIEDVPFDVFSYMMQTANVSASLLFQGLNLQGTNIICTDGKQGDFDRVCVNVIGRKEEDGLNFMWQPKPGDQASIKVAADSIKSALIVNYKKTAASLAQKEAGEEIPTKPDVPQVEHETSKPENDHHEEHKKRIKEALQNYFYVELNRLP